MASNKAQIVQIVALPDALRSNARLLRIEGEVVRQNNDGSTRLRTPYGDVDILLRGRQPQTGHMLEIDIPAGSPPRSASVRHSATPPQSSPRQPSDPQAPTPPPQNQPAPLPAARQPAQPPAAESGSAPVKDGNTQPLQPAPLPAQTKPGVAPAAPAKTPQASGTAPAAAAPPAQPAPALPPLTPGQIVTLLPDPAGQIIAAQGAKAEMAARQVQSSMAQSLLQTVKTILPQSLAGTIDKIAPPQPSGAGNQAAPAQTGTGAPPFTQTAPLSTPLQSGHILPPLHAQVLAVTLPSGQVFTMMQSPGGAASLQAAQASLPTNPAQNAQAITAQPAGTQSGTGTPSATAAQNAPLSGGSRTPLLTVTVEQLTAQNKPVIPIRIDAGGTVRNFIIQAPAASVPIGAQVTLMPLLSANAAAAGHNGAFPASAPQSGQPPLIQAATGMPLPAGAAPATVPNLATMPPAWRAALPLMQVGTLWPVMDDLFQSFYQTTPQAAQILGRVIPSPANPASFGPALMLFAAALRSGDLQAWIGDKKLDLLAKTGKQSIMARLSGETAPLAGGTDAAAHDWKSLPIPLLWQNEISKIMFHVRKEPSENDRDEKDAATRFVMDLALTRMGDVQLDGLVRGNRIDLVVRTQNAISASMQDAMRTAYAKALDNTAIYGEIGFQSGGQGWENVLKHEAQLTSSA